LERHLTKYQTLHPKTSVGEFKGESVYEREHVKDLHTAEKWIQEGKIVKSDEEPFKTARKRTKKKRVAKNFRRMIHFFFCCSETRRCRENERALWTMASERFCSTDSKRWKSTKNRYFHFLSFFLSSLTPTFFLKSLWQLLSI
jgi:hypothetical protein